MKLWDTNAMKVVQTFELRQAVYTHNMTAGHTLVAVATHARNITLCDLKVEIG